MYDSDYPLDIYTWVQIHTDANDIFLLPPELSDFKARTKRSTYFDFKSTLYHKSAIFHWYNRFQEVYGMEAEGRTTHMDLFKEVNRHYLKGEEWKSGAIDYVITRNNQKIPERELVFSDGNFKIFK